MKLLVEIIRSVRNSRAEVNTPMSKKIKMMVKAKDQEVLNTLENNRAYIERFCNPEELVLALEIETPDKAMTAVVTGAEIILPLEGLLNIEEEVARLQKEWDKLNKVERVQKKLGNEGFIKKAPEKVIEEEKAKEKDYSEKRAAVEARIKELKGE
jgi:valyl-tRNA synthetase